MNPPLGSSPTVAHRETRPKASTVPSPDGVGAADAKEARLTAERQAAWQSFQPQYPALRCGVPPHPPPRRVPVTSPAGVSPLNKAGSESSDPRVVDIGAHSRVGQQMGLAGLAACTPKLSGPASSVLVGVLIRALSKAGRQPEPRTPRRELTTMRIALLGTGFGQAHAAVYASHPDVEEVVVFRQDTPETGPDERSVRVPHHHRPGCPSS